MMAAARSFVDVFPLAPVMPTTTAVHGVALLGGEAQQHALGLVDAHGRAGGRGSAGPDDGRDRAGGERIADVGVAVVALASHRDEEIPGADPAAIDLHGGHDDVRALDVPRQDVGDLREAPLPHDASPCSARSSCAATTRSSNATDPSANSCPVSWPFPAMTTTSRGRAARRASRIAVRRSGSTT